MRWAWWSPWLLVGCEVVSVAGLQGEPVPEDAELRVRVDAPELERPLTDFPVALFLRPDRLDTSASADGADLRVTTAGGEPLPFEVEQWGPAAVVWVRVPLLEDGTTLFVSLSGGSGPNRARVWAGWDAVWHLADLTDSSERLPPLTTTAEAAAGRVGGAWDVATDHLDIGERQPLLQDTSEATLSAWVFAESEADGQVISISANGPRPELSRAYVSFERGSLVGGGRPTGEVMTQTQTWDGAVRPGAWHHVAATLRYDADEVALYFDGSLVTPNAAVPRFEAPRTESAAPVGGALGAEDLGGRDRAFFGLLDEVRIEPVARSSAWISLSYRSGLDQLLIYEQL